MSTPRQVVVIMTDTQRKDMLGCYGNSVLQTPALDRLSTQGMRCERAYTCQPVCGPARAALFTGMYPHANGVWANGMPLGDTIKTIGQRLSDHGIPAAYIGKWHLDGGDYFGTGRCPAGWLPEYWYDMRCYLEERSPDERRRSRQRLQDVPGGVRAEETFGHRCSTRACDFLATHAAGDFLLVVSYDEPHGPFHCPEPFASMYKEYQFPKGLALYDTLRDKPAHQRVWSSGFCDESKEAKDDFVIQRPEFFGCNTFVDAQLGRVLAAIDQHAPGALVIYTADHGDMLGQHGIWGKGPAAYDAITNIPLLVRWPGVTPAGTVCHQPLSHISLTPSILEFFGLPQPKTLDGPSMLATLRDPQRPSADAVFIEYGRYEVDHDGFGGFQPLRAVFDGRFKLCVNLLGTDELYDLSADPEEMVNLIEQPATAAVRDRLHDRLIAWMNETRDPFRGTYWLQRPWRSTAPQLGWEFTGMTRQREEDERYEPRQLDYDTGLPMADAVRRK